MSLGFKQFKSYFSCKLFDKVRSDLTHTALPSQQIFQSLSNSMSLGFKQFKSYFSCKLFDKVRSDLTHTALPSQQISNIGFTLGLKFLAYLSWKVRISGLCQRNHW